MTALGQTHLQMQNDACYARSLAGLAGGRECHHRCYPAG
jgi:hypothetical protein